MLAMIGRMRGVCVCVVFELWTGVCVCMDMSGRLCRGCAMCRYGDQSLAG